MNERIRELAIQSGLPTALDYHQKRYEKFAELIVQDCLNMIENEASAYAEPVWAFELVNDIRERFGVEE